MKLKIIIVSIAISLLIAGTFGCASKSSTPEEITTVETSWQYPAIVDVDFIGKYAKVPMDENVMIIDSRPKRAKYDKGHIPMAVSIPNTKFDKMTNLLPKNKNTMLIFYCGGLKCKLSHKSAYKAEKLGYSNVKVFAEGFPKWLSVKGNYAQVSVDWMKKQIDAKKDMTLIDSRPKRKKYDKAHIPTAINIPDSQFKKMTSKLPKDKSKLVVFYCGGYKCKLSHKSAAKTIALGYTNVKVFSGGFPEWKKIAKGSSTVAKAPANIKSGKEEGSIDIALFKNIVNKNPKSVFLVDVRDKDEFDKGTLNSAVNIPVDFLEDKIKTLPSNKAVVFICGTGARSGESYYMVKDLRPDFKEVYYLDAELTIKKDGSYNIKKVE